MSENLGDVKLSYDELLLVKEMLKYNMVSLLTSKIQQIAEELGWNRDKMTEVYEGLFVKAFDGVIAYEKSIDDPEVGVCEVCGDWFRIIDSCMVCRDCRGDKHD